MWRYLSYISLLVLAVSTVILIGAQMKILGFGLLFCGAVLLYPLKTSASRAFFLAYLAIAILGFSPITTDLSALHFMTMGVVSLLAIVLPALVARNVFHMPISYRLRLPLNWQSSPLLYVLLPVTLLGTYLLLPWYLRITGSYLNWHVTYATLVTLFIGINALGIWDEIFFKANILEVLRKVFPFWVANITQGILFSAFLYALGFRGWGYIITFCFGIAQGIVYQKTNSLFYVLLVHITVDLILFFALAHENIPALFPFMMTG